MKIVLIDLDTRRERAEMVHAHFPVDIFARPERLRRDIEFGEIERRGRVGSGRYYGRVTGEDGADYIAFGEPGRPAGPPLLELIEWWNQLFVLPCLAEGAFDRGELERLARIADFIGVGDEVWRHPDGAAAAVRNLLNTIAAGG